MASPINVKSLDKSGERTLAVNAGQREYKSEKHPQNLGLSTRHRRKKTRTALVNHANVLCRSKNYFQSSTTKIVGMHKTFLDRLCLPAIVGAAIVKAMKLEKFV